MDDNYKREYPYSGYYHGTAEIKAKMLKLDTLKTGYTLMGLLRNNNIYTVVVEKDPSKRIGLRHAEYNNNKKKISDIYDYYTLKALAKEFANVDSIIIIPPEELAKMLKLDTLETGDTLMGLLHDNNIYTVVVEKDPSKRIGLRPVEGETVEGETVEGETVKGKTVHYTLEKLANKFDNADSIEIIKPNEGGKIRRNTSSKKLKKRTTLKRRKTKSRK
jgi:hypothetical protein